MEIKTPEQMPRDPFRGHLYENLVIADAFKCAYNTDRDPRLFPD